jgi:CRP-like cAMP-binding protein
MISPELLRRFKLFGGLEHDMFEAIAQFSNELTVESDTYLFEQNDNAEELYLVLKGSVDLLMDMDEEGEVRNEVETVVAGEFVGWSAFIEPHTYKLSAATTEESHLLVVEAEKLRKLLEDNPGAGYKVMTRIAETIGTRLTNMRMRLMSFSP